MGIFQLRNLAKLVRHHILTSTTAAGSGHPTSSLSAADVLTALLFGGFFKFDLEHPDMVNNDRLIFSKGHASPLLYALFAAAGAVSREELLTLRKFGSFLEGHPTPAFKFTEAATGSLGQGLSVGVGMALAAKINHLPCRTFVLLGDSEMAEGSVWEAMEIAAYYKLNNLVAILDCNRLGQRGETMFGHRVEEYQKRVEAFGWDTAVVDGHDLEEIIHTFNLIGSRSDSDQFSNKLQNPNAKQTPKLIIAKTLKGKGVSFLEDKEGWHGKALSAEELEKALAELGEVDKGLIGIVERPLSVTSPVPPVSGDTLSHMGEGRGELKYTAYLRDKPVATRKAYGNALVNLYPFFPNMVVLDAEVSNSTFAEIFKAKYPERFLEMFIAEQNMVGSALGLARRGFLPFVSTFAAFWTRAFDQIRMASYSGAHIVFCGSHAGVSIGEDGVSQMGLEDLAMFRSIHESTVLYPSDAVSCEALAAAAAKHKGIVYIRTTRKDTPIIYTPLDKGTGEGIKHEFRIGGSCVLKSSDHDTATVVTAGITLHEALAAYEELKKEEINIRVVDLYSIKPLDIDTLQTAAKDTGTIITVEDHYAEGGIGEAVSGALMPILNFQFSIFNLAVHKMPKSGKPDELLAYEEIDRYAIIKRVKELVKSKD